MRFLLALVGIAALLLVGAMALGLVRVTQTQDAQLPRLSGGATPKFHADVANISVAREEHVVEVPTIAMKPTTVTLPKIKVDRPEPAAAPANANAN